ncbi:MAG: hypothetical protein WCY32_14540 [Burkholderiaceae bacterium]
MDIKQAIERVRAIDEKLDSIKRFIDAGHPSNADVAITCGSWSISITSLFACPERLALIERERERLKAERAKLMSVIDMANAALKGIGA